MKLAWDKVNEAQSVLLKQLFWVAMDVWTCVTITNIAYLNYQLNISPIIAIATTSCIPRKYCIRLDQNMELNFI